MQSQAVKALNNDPVYQKMVRKTVAKRKKAKESARFKNMRSVIRANATAARKTYAVAAQAKPDTPMLQVQSMLAADTWEAIDELCDILKRKGWFNVPPRNSQLLNEPACAWLTAGISKLSLKSKFLSALNKHVLREAIQHWIEYHFVFPVGGTDQKGEHHNFMEQMVTFVWGFYTENQRPKVPAMTDVGRFLFTYIWRHQHPLLR